MLSTDHRLKKYKIKFPTWWVDISDSNPNGPPTFIDERLNEPGVLQISDAEYVRGQKPNPSNEDLIAMSENIGIKNDFGKVINKHSGNCKFGAYGMVEFSNSNFPYISVWHLSNGKDFIFSTFICSQTPEVSEIDEVKEILVTMKKKSLLF